MGRLFWKFFICIWLAQLAGMVGTGVLFWLEHRGREPDGRHVLSPAAGDPSPRVGPPPAFDGRPPPLPIFDGPPPGPPPTGGPDGRGGPGGPGGPHIPYAHIGGGLLASLLFAAGLAAYVARPVRRLRRAFDAAAEGDLDQRVATAMGRRRDELADLGRDFDRMCGRLQALMSSQTRLLHDVSHELRSPLARLHAAIGLLRQQPERIEETVQRIEREGERINRLVGELLTLSRLEAAVGGALETVDLGELLEGLVDDARFEAATRDLTVDLVCDPEIAVRANPEMLHRAIENIVRNALRHSPRGGRVEVSARLAAAQTCRIAVRDHGPGVLPSQLTQIFEPFFRGEEKPGGYGLGLAIAQRTVQALGGSIRAENAAEGGLRVVIELPFLPAA